VGGISMHINHNLSYKIRKDLSLQEDDYEMMWIELENKDLRTEKNYIIGTIYRRPGSNINLFNQILAEKLQIISLENKVPIHMGDYNVDLLKCDTHPPSSEFLDTNMLHTLLPSITKPTRVTNSSATIIDNIFSNYIDSTKLSSYILTTDISDHYPICYFSLTTDFRTNISTTAKKEKKGPITEKY
jgi:hypothetical protein